MLFILRLFKPQLMQPHQSNRLFLKSQDNFLNPEFIKHFDSDEEEVLSKYKVQTSVITNFEKTKRQLEYYFSSIHISGSNFTENYAFGAGINSGNGGALLASSSMILDTNNKFNSNVANSGGSICSISSSLAIQQSQFSKNVAFRYSGACIIQGNDLKNNLQFVCISSTFESNTCGNTGGALSVIFNKDVFIDGCTFKGNSATYGGGALELLNNPHVQIVDTKFIQNSLKMNNLANFSQNTHISPPNYMPRGGGAIYYGEVENQKLENQFISHLSTQKCCFIQNTAGDNSYLFRNSTSPGNEILFFGKVSWNSIDDYTYDFENSALMQFNTNDFNGELNFGFFSMNREKRCEESISSSFVINNRITFVNYTNGNDKSSGTSDIASPTEYTYQATPITRLPKPTTESHKYSQNPYSNIFNIYNYTRVVSQTYFATPFTTPLETNMETFYETPLVTNQETAFETPVETIFETAFFTPYDTPLVTNQETVFETPVETNFETAFFTPWNTPFFTPKPSPDPTPSRTPEKSPEPTKTPLYNDGLTWSKSQIQTVTLKEEDTLSETITNTTTTTYIDKKLENSTTIVKETYILVNVKTFTEETIITIIELVVEKRYGGLTSSQMILISCIAMLVITSLAMLGIFLFRQSTKNDSDFSNSSDTSETDIIFDNEPTRASINDVDNSIETVNDNSGDDNDEDDNYMNNMDF